MKQRIYQPAFYSIIMFVCMALLFACKKNEDTITPAPPSSTPAGTVRPVGTSLGAATTKQIGTEGGTLSLPDGSLSISIPAGALASATTISIEHITNTNKAGVGKAYRIMPHGNVFTKPVQLTFSYAALTDSIASQKFLSIASQDGRGIWNMYSASQIDVQNKKLTISTKHFSDWTIMEWMRLSPAYAVVGTEEQEKIVAQRYVPLLPGDLSIQWPTLDSVPVGDPYPLEKEYIRGWHLGGDGMIVSQTNTCFYTAPPLINNNQDVSAVSLELESQQQLLLVCNINLVKNNNLTISINGGPWLDFEAACLKLDNTHYSITSVSNNTLFTINWPGGFGVHPWVSGADDNSDGDNQVSFMYVPVGKTTSYDGFYEINSEIKTSGGALNITQMGAKGDFVSGTFSVSPAGFYSLTDGKCIGTASIEGKFRVKRMQ